MEKRCECFAGFRRWYVGMVGYLPVKKESET